MTRPGRVGVLGLVMTALLLQGGRAAAPGLPFTEDFSDTNLRDAARTNADWSTEKQALLLAWRQRHYGTFGATVTGSDVSDDMVSADSVALGDVDGDGDLDLVVGVANGPNRLYLNNGTADPWSGVTGSDISADADFTYSVALGDVDGDGDLDLVAGNIQQPNRLYLNNGTADPWGGVKGSNISDDVGGTHSVALGDVDGDGDLDLVAGNSTLPSRLYLNNGTSDPWSGAVGSNISDDLGDAYSVALGDVDGDGHLDLVVGNYDQPNRLYLNNGSADPWGGVAGSDITADSDLTFSVALGDVDGDGDLDLVVGNYAQNRLYLNNGTSDPWGGVAGIGITSDANFTRSVALGDVDGDGDLDLVAGNFNQPDRLYINNGSSDPWGGVVGTSITADTLYTTATALGDVDGDGDLDLVAGTSFNQPNRLYLNDGTTSPWNGGTGSNLSADTGRTLSIALGDVDRDGDLDLVAGRYGQTNRLYLNNGTSDPWNGVVGSDISTDAGATEAVALADVDGDGHLDLVVGNLDQPNRLYLNNGTSNPWNGVTGSDITSDAGSTDSVALGDVDGDGDLDLVAGNRGQPNRLYMNNGTTDPWAGVGGSDITSDADATDSIALADVDGDGDLDLVAGNLDQPNRLYLNNGTSNPWNGVTGSDISTDAGATEAVALADVDGDGHLDLVVGNLDQPNRLYLNNGTSNPWNGVTGSDITSDAGSTDSVALGDVDGDGDLDLVAGNRGQPNRLYMNNGTTDPWAGVGGSDITSDADATSFVTLGDVDGDGDLDLVAGNAGQANRLYLNNGTADPWNGVAGSDITSDSDSTSSVALGDVDRDGDLDLVAGNAGQANRLYLNNGTADPWGGVVGYDITAEGNATDSVVLGDVDGDGDLDLIAGNDAQPTRLYLNDGVPDPWTRLAGSDITTDSEATDSVALGDVDGDGDIDLVAGNVDEPNRLYLNNGTADPWSGVTGSPITTDADHTTSVALRDVDGDGDLDLVAGNLDQPNRLYLNNGTADPWNGVIGSDITADADATVSIALGDVDGDGDLDLVAGNQGRTNRLYLNNGTADPWNGVIGSDITADADDTSSVALGDVDGDGDLDLVAGNQGQTNRLYLNNGTADPWGAVAGSDITADAHFTSAVALADMDGDGDLDLVAGNDGQTNRLYLNNGTADPWSAVSGSDITADARLTRAVVLADVDRDGVLDLVTGSNSQTNRLYRPQRLYDTSRGKATSLRVDTETECITNATLGLLGDLPLNTGLDVWLSNNGGSHWSLVRPGFLFFPICGADLRWRADLHSLSPARSPRLDRIDIASEYSPPRIGDRVWEDLDGDGIQDAGEPGLVAALVYLYDDSGSLVDFTFTGSNGLYSFSRPWSDDRYSLRFIPPPGYTISPRDQGSDDALDSDADPATGYTSLFPMKALGTYARWDAGMTPATTCVPPDEAIYLYVVTLSTDGQGYPILNFMDFNQPDQVTGYNIHRSSDPSLPPSSWPLVASDIIDGDEATPNKQWVDISGDVAPGGTWYYTVTAYNHHCPIDQAEGPF